MSNISMEFQEITLEVQNSKETVQSVVVLMDEVSKNFSALCDVFLVICHELNLGSTTYDQLKDLLFPLLATYDLESNFQESTSQRK